MHSFPVEESIPLLVTEGFIAFDSCDPIIWTNSVQLRNHSFSIFSLTSDGWCVQMEGKRVVGVETLPVSSCGSGKHLISDSGNLLHHCLSCRCEKRVSYISVMLIFSWTSVLGVQQRNPFMSCQSTNTHLGLDGWYSVCSQTHERFLFCSLKSI